MLRGKRVAALITDGYHHQEMIEPLEAVTKAGAETTIIGVDPRHVSEGLLDFLSAKLPDNLKPKPRVRAHRLVADVKAEDFDALLIPGAYAPEQLRLVPDAIALVRETYAQKRIIAAICHGPQLLIAAEIVSGKDMTCVKTIAIDLKNAGAIYVDRPVVRDGNIITARVPADLPQFNQALIDSLS